MEVHRARATGVGSCRGYGLLDALGRLVASAVVVLFAIAQPLKACEEDLTKAAAAHVRVSGSAQVQLDAPQAVRARGLPRPPRTPCEKALQESPFTDFDKLLADAELDTNDVLNHAIAGKACLPEEVDQYFLSIGARRIGIAKSGRVISYVYRTTNVSWLGIIFGYWIQVELKSGIVHGIVVAVNK
jgi:hypothetical protein